MTNSPLLPFLVQKFAIVAKNISGEFVYLDEHVKRYVTPKLDEEYRDGVALEISFIPVLRVVSNASIYYYILDEQRVCFLDDTDFKQPAKYSFNILVGNEIVSRELKMNFVFEPEKGKLGNTNNISNEIGDKYFVDLAFISTVFNYKVKGIQKKHIFNPT